MQKAFATIEQRYEQPDGKVLNVVADLACNVDDETIYENVRKNAARKGKWLKMAEPKTAILCGSGPSLKDSLEEIRRSTHDVFAMNGASRFLADHGIIPDYQVIMDARRESAELVGPALRHLFASQVHPECFNRAPDAILWHSTHGAWTPEFPDYGDDYCVIGGSVSVGNTALALAFAMGYRRLICYGYDSSHKGTESHVFRQKLNENDACVIVPFEGTDYVCSYAMRLQADSFIERAKALEANGCEVHVKGYGLLPAKWAAYKRPMPEQEKYEQMWKHGEYRVYSPGEVSVVHFLERSSPGRVMDIGCGTGRASLELAKHGYEPMLVDFAGNCRDHAALAFPFVQADITKNIPQWPGCQYTFCADVMEHIPPEDVEATLANIARLAPKAFFQISLVPDSMGALIGKPLHLTVKPFSWWTEKLSRFGTIEWSKNEGESAMFYLSTT